jgi:dimethylaniline monooxygenase (N-oxide forming)
LARRLSPGGGLFLHTWHPDLPALGVIGQFLLQGPYFPLLELQARWIVAAFAGEVALPNAREMSETPTRPPLEAHDALGLALAEAQGVAPDLDAHPDLAELLLLGPLLPCRYRLDGPGAIDGAADTFVAQVAQTPAAPRDDGDLDRLRDVGLSLVAAQLRRDWLDGAHEETRDRR